MENNTSNVKYAINKLNMALAIVSVLAFQANAQPGATDISQGDLEIGSFDMSPYAGATVRLVFAANSCDGSPLGMIVDNVALSAGGSVLNGSFESWLDDWIVNDSGGVCSIYPAAEGDPFGFEGGSIAPVPTDGVVLTASSAILPGPCQLHQDVDITGPETLSADLGWTFTRFAESNPGCSVALQVESLDGNILERAIVFSPPAAQLESVPTMPWWSPALLGGFPGLAGQRGLASVRSK